MSSAFSPTIKFRSGTPADALCVGVLATQVFLDTYATEGIRSDLAREALAVYSPAVFSERLAHPSTFFILAEHCGHLLGFAELMLGTQCPNASISGGAELVRLYIQRPFKRKGLGSSLLAQAERLAAERSAVALWLTVWTGNVSALHFYTAQGYKDVGATSYVFEDNAYENRILTKTLFSS